MKFLLYITAGWAWCTVALIIRQNFRVRSKPFVPATQHDKQMLSLFKSEATIWISLEKHPYIVRAYLVEIFDNLPYVIAEYVSGPKGWGWTCGDGSDILA